MGELHRTDMKLILLAALVASATASYKWDSCGTKLDRLKTSKVSVDGKLSAGSKVTVTASGTTDLHVPLDSGAWQVRVYEAGVAKETHTEFGDLMKALKFDDPKNTTFTVTVSFTLPKKQASGNFTTSLVATDQAKGEYMCLEVKYEYAELLAEVEDSSAYCMNDASKKAPYYCHAPAEPIYCKTDKDCVTPWYNSFCMNDDTKHAPYLCKVELPPTCTTDKDCQRSVLPLTQDIAMSIVEDSYYLHHVDEEDHKCFEASASSKFASKGITDTGKCPSEYNTVDKSTTVLQCPDGVTSIRYCSPINVTIETKGQALSVPMQYFVGSNAECSKDSDCPSSYCQNGFCHGCFDKCCETDADCTKKGFTYCQNDSTKMPPYFCHA